MAISLMIGKIFHIFRTRGIAGVTRAVVMRLRRLMAGHAESFHAYQQIFAGKTGIEIGGPSQVFTQGGIFPVYPVVGHLDNCNFGNDTVWEGDIKQGQTFQFDRRKPAGRQYILEATAIGCLNSGAYDFVLSSHVLEHVANPILAISEWMRVLADDGTLVLLLPDKKYTFDHRRPVTTMEHLIADFEAGVTEEDLTHLPEILALHDLKRDPEAGDSETFKGRSMRNVENRCLHHHVFDAELAVELVEYSGLEVHAVEEIYPHHILVLAKKNRNPKCAQ
jgi:SAM-dependent methyltransferase